MRHENNDSKVIEEFRIVYHAQMYVKANESVTIYGSSPKGSDVRYEFHIAGLIPQVYLVSNNILILTSPP
jgi:hypothetical protein